MATRAKAKRAVQQEQGLQSAQATADEAANVPAKNAVMVNSKELTEKVPVKGYAGNIVLYRIDGKDVNGKTIRFPLFSVDPREPTAAMQVQFHANESMRAEQLAGKPISPLQVVKEFRQADEAGKLTKTEYTLLNPTTLQPLGAAVSKLEDL